MNAIIKVMGCISLLSLSVGVFGQGFLTFPTGYSCKSGDPPGVNDYSVENGTKVRAAASGWARATTSKNSGSYGSMIITTPNNSHETRYAHLSGYVAGIMANQLAVRVGQEQIIGYFGNSGGPWDIIYKVLITILGIFYAICYTLFGIAIVYAAIGFVYLLPVIIDLAIGFIIWVIKLPFRLLIWGVKRLIGEDFYDAIAAGVNIGFIIMAVLILVPLLIKWYIGVIVQYFQHLQYPNLINVGFGIIMIIPLCFAFPIIIVLIKDWIEEGWFEIELWWLTSDVGEKTRLIILIIMTVLIMVLMIILFYFTFYFIKELINR